MTDKPSERPPYFKMAFANPYNLTLLGGALAASVITLNPILALAAIGAEGLWLLHGPDSKLLRKLLWDPQFAKLREQLDAAALEQRLNSMPRSDAARCRALLAKQMEIDRLALQNPSFTAELLRNELHKTRKLVDSFVEMATTCGRYERYLESVDLNELDRERQKYEKRSEWEKISDQERDIAKRNLAIILKRIDKLREIRNYLNVARSQLDLIENSFRLIADQIVTMQSPGELSGQLDDLLDGVESIKQTAVDTDRILNTLEA